MPFDAPQAASLPVDSATFHGVPRHELACHALARLGPSQRAAVIAVEMSEAGTFVNMGMNFGRVIWRMKWRHAGLPEMSGSIAVRNGEIVQ
jgi:hypothetical protein